MTIPIMLRPKELCADITVDDSLREEMFQLAMQSVRELPPGQSHCEFDGSFVLLGATTPSVYGILVGEFAYQVATSFGKESPNVKK